VCLISHSDKAAGMALMMLPEGWCSPSRRRVAVVLLLSGGIQQYCRGLGRVLEGAEAMRSIVLLAALATAAVLSAGSAEAQSLFAPASGSWTGFYVGGQADLLATKSLEEQDVSLGAPTLLGDMGGGLGVFAGYDYQFSDWLVGGLGAEYNFDSTQLQFGGANYGASNWDAAIKARVGTPIAPNVLAYGSLGYQWGHFDYSNRPSMAGATDAAFTTGGPQFGLGVDAMLTENIMARFEGTYTHYESHTASNGIVSTPSMIAIKAGLAFKFD
jgi:opacity protein-like surface antigen